MYVLNFGPGITDEEPGGGGETAEWNTGTQVVDAKLHSTGI